MQMSVYPTTYAREQAGINKAKAETAGLNLPAGILYDPTSGQGGADAGPGTSSAAGSAAVSKISGSAAAGLQKLLLWLQKLLVVWQ